ncbi:MAG: four helix bundle protein [Candidatus Taylorbacteria bacterium]
MIQNFTDLNAWKEAHKLAIEIYSVTKKFPKEELFGLTSQMRRAAVSVTSNIAEGFGRHGYFVKKS